jgi:cell wall-associated NlpC family hydrolase
MTPTWMKAAVCHKSQVFDRTFSGTTVKLFRKTFSLAALVAAFVASAPVLALPAGNTQSVNNSRNESESPTATLISSGDVAPSSWAIAQRLDAWVTLPVVDLSIFGVLQRMDTLDAPERDEQNMAVRRVTSASQSPAVHKIVEQDVPSSDSDSLARTPVEPDASVESSIASSSTNAVALDPSAPTTDSSAVSATAAPAVEPVATPVPVKPTNTVTASSTRKAKIGVAGTARRPKTVGANTASKTVVASKATAVSPVSKKINRMKVSPVKALPRRDAAQLSARHKNRILLARLEADLMRANRGLDRANDTLSEGQKQLMKVGTTLRTAMLEAGPDAKGLHPFVRVAMRYAGTPYVWGGESRNGFDCSGFIIVVMRDLGYRALPHSAAEQFNYGMPISQELLKPGDIVFFKNTYKPGVSHVGIYLGNRRFINAAGTGKGTIVSSLDEPKWRVKYAGARRLIRS